MACDADANGNPRRFDRPLIDITYEDVSRRYRRLRAMSYTPRIRLFGSRGASIALTTRVNTGSSTREPDLLETNCRRFGAHPVFTRGHATHLFNIHVSRTTSISLVRASGGSLLFSSPFPASILCVVTLPRPESRNSISSSPCSATNCRLVCRFPRRASKKHTGI